MATSDILLHGAHLGNDVGMARADEAKTIADDAKTTADLALSEADDLINQLGNKEPCLTDGSVTDYLSGDKTWQDLATSIKASLLTGLNVIGDTAITAADSILIAFGKLQGQINGLVKNLGGVPSIQSGLMINRPAAAVEGRVYIAYDIPAVYQDNGTSWTTIALGAVINGAVLQALSSYINATSGTTQKADNNTTPVITDGVQVWSQQITPSEETTKISFRGSVYVDHSNNNRRVAIALFRNNVCVGVASSNVQQSGSGITMALSFRDIPGVNTPVTYSLRCWANGGGTWYINQCSTPYFNGLMAKQALEVQEIA